MYVEREGRRPGTVSVWPRIRVRVRVMSFCLVAFRPGFD